MSHETGAEVVSGDFKDPGAIPEQRRGPGSRAAEWLRANLFLRTASGPVGWRKILLAFGFVIAGTAISLSRTVGPGGSLDTIWIEDAKYLLNQALNGPLWKTFTLPISSYYQEPARLATAIAVQFPLAWAPGVMATLAAAQYSVYGLVAYIASGPHLRNIWLRLLVSVPVCCIPVAGTQANNDLVTVQFLAMYGAFWAVLWVPGTRAGRILSPIVMLSVAGTTVLAIVFLPLLVARLIVDRSWNALALTGCWLAGMYLEFSPTLFGHSNKFSIGFNGPVWVLRNYADRVLPRALFGERTLGGPEVSRTGTYAPLHITNMAAHDVLIASAWLVIVVVVILAATRFTEPNWPLAVVAALFSVCVWADEMVINLPIVQSRYVITPALLLYVVLAALLRPRQRARPGERQSRARTAVRWLPLAGVAVMLVVAVTLNFRVVNGRSNSQPWTSVISNAQAACATPGVTSFQYVHEWWSLSIPCSKV